MMLKKLFLRPLCYILVYNFITRVSFKKSERRFFTKCLKILRVHWHLKSALWWQSWNFKCCKMADFHIFTFSSATRGHFPNVSTLLASIGHLVDQKHIVQIFKRWSSKKVKGQNVEQSGLRNSDLSSYQVTLIICFLCNIWWQLIY